MVPIKPRLINQKSGGSSRVHGRVGAVSSIYKVFAIFHACLVSVDSLPAFPVPRMQGPLLQCNSEVDAMESNGQDIPTDPEKVPQSVKIGIFHEEHPLDTTDEFNNLMQACRRGDLKTSQELISGGVNLNGRDKYDYTPLIIVRA
jgi:hypothetical protein